MLRVSTPPRIEPLPPPPSPPLWENISWSASASIQQFLPFPPPAMASRSIDVATTFMGLARRPTSLPTLVRSMAFPLSWRPIAHRSFQRSAIHPRILGSGCGMPSLKRGSRRFTAAATAASTERETSDVVTKIPQDNRIPATIITGFLGSGKVVFGLIKRLVVFFGLRMWKIKIASARVSFIYF